MLLSRFAALWIVVLPVGALAQQPSSADGDRAARVAWLKEHAIALKSIDPADEDFSDLEPLRKAIGEARIVQLGEQSHGDGATFHAKARLIKFLHQKMGFDVLAMESGLYDCRKAWEALREGGDPYFAVTRGVFGTWTMSEQFQPVIAYLGQAAKTGRPLELCGFDCQFSASSTRNTIQDDVKAVLEELDPQALDATARAALLEELRSMRGASDDATYEKRRSLFGKFAEALASARPSERFSAAELSFWRQFAESLGGYAAELRDFERDYQKANNARDIQMAKNFVWLAREKYPTRKIIVWAASGHLMRNPAAVIPNPGAMVTDEAGPKPAPADYYQGAATMGDGVWKALGRETYTLAFSAANGEGGLAWGKPYPLAPALPGSLEDLAVAAGSINIIIDFRQLDESGAWLRQKLAARPMGYGYMTANWTDIFDGLVFTRTMYPSTMTPRAQPAIGRLAEGWFGPPKGATDFEGGLDVVVKHSGRASAYLKATANQPSGENGLRQVFAADNYRGKRLRMSAYVRTQDVEGSAGLWMRVNGRELIGLAFDNMSTRPIKGTTDWAKHEIVLDVPAEATDISFGIVVSGRGQTWVDDIRFEPVGQDVSTTTMPTPPVRRRSSVSEDLPKEPRNLDFEL